MTDERFKKQIHIIIFAEKRRLKNVHVMKEKSSKIYFYLKFTQYLNRQISFTLF